MHYERSCVPSLCLNRAICTESVLLWARATERQLQARVAQQYWAGSLEVRGCISTQDRVTLWWQLTNFKWLRNMRTRHL